MGVCSKGRKKRNERVKVSSDSTFCSFTRRGLLADLERPAEIWVGVVGGYISDRAGGGGVRGRRGDGRGQKDHRPACGE